MLDTIRSLFEPPYVYGVGALGVVLLVFLVWLARYMNRRYVLLYRSSGTDQIAFELARIADALELMARRRAKLGLPVAQVPQGIGLSMFGR